ncbi:hypothetical protein M0811_00369 [Anaeramoeba ignava]|uniref:Uncharacterized protein n=1 Tax=Anaeramoeba ignava TaxID=1746090 RepID=A0A9Q0REF0_ANAIG|nr:hypothetical protein M0811_00369 [Anaeramoeba ignava]|eukprot:Anaeramoba_ignava/a354174_35.p1 GENE.a354174_35~~a354174_35.p1  ORF type:complete len:100 (+),score=35.32 a354174_35:35-301(+)
MEEKINELLNRITIIETQLRTGSKNQIGNETQTNELLETALNKLEENERNEFQILIQTNKVYQEKIKELEAEINKQNYRITHLKKHIN